MANNNQIKQGNTLLGIALACKKKYSARKITTVAIDGTPYVQSTGLPEDRRDVSIYCETKDKRDKTDTASNTAAQISVYWHGETLKGYIDGNIRWDEFRDEHGVGHFTLLVLEVVGE